MAKQEVRDIKLQEKQMLLVHSRRLKQTMVIYMTGRDEKYREPLTGMLIKDSASSIMGSLDTSKVQVDVLDFDTEPEFAVSGMVDGLETDYALGVENVSSELKLVLMRKMEKEREVSAKKEEPKKEEISIYMER